ncbi:unnamed protein product [Rhizopus stolonifer]
MSGETTLSWDKELSQFFKGIGLIETSECLDSELIVLSRSQLEKLPNELRWISGTIIKCLERHVDAKEDILDKPDKTHKDLLLKRPRGDDDDENKERIKRMDAKRNELDESNRTEFLSRHDPTADDVTCARTDAREINRNIQMKFDIVNNEDGPLARSTTTTAATASFNKEKEAPLTKAEFIERINNVEQHLNVKLNQNANPPFSIFERVKILENTLMEIEREHPTWAAVHFNQPSRTFPPPPPITYITRAPENGYTSTQINTTAPQTGMFKTTGRANSSLTRAVIDQLNIHKQLSDAMSDSHTQ